MSMQKQTDWTPEPEDIAATVGHPPGTPAGLYDRLKYVAEVLQELRTQGATLQGACLAQRRSDRSVDLDALADSTTVGRSDECVIPVEDSRLSRQHFRIAQECTDREIEDLGSTNGTRVNGESLAGVRSLCSGDLIEAGSTVFVFIET